MGNEECPKLYWNDCPKLVKSPVDNFSNYMLQPQRTNRIDITSTNLDRLLASMKEQGKPLILTEEGRGVAAIVPYTDPATLTKDDSPKKF